MKLNSLLKAAPSKFGKGISVLWRGNNLSTVNDFFLKNLFRMYSSNEIAKEKNIFLFESARSAIYNCLEAYGVGDGDDVIVSSFTCDAVTSAVMRTGASVVYVDINSDLSMCEEDVFSAIGSSTKAIIVQNTFGKLGLDLDAFDKVRSKGVFIIEDCALSVGSKINEQKFGTFGDVSVWSLEVSKTITIGWGGVLSVSNIVFLDALADRYTRLGRVSMLSDIRRLFQLWFSLLMVRVKIPGAILVWYFMYGTRIFRRSNNFGKKHSLKHERMGKISTLLFYYMAPSFESFFEKTNNNYITLLSEANRLGLKYPVSKSEEEYVVSPRFSLLVNRQDIKDIISQGNKIGVEVGCWFDESPPRLRIDETRVFSSSKAENISNHIINLPCHWSLTKNELSRIKDLMEYIASIKSVGYRG